MDIKKMRLLFLAGALLFLAVSCYYRYPQSVRVTEAHYNSSTNELEISLSDRLLIDEDEFDWSKMCFPEDNSVTETYFEYGIIHLKLENTYDSATDKGKVVKFKDKFVKCRVSDGDKNGCLELDFTVYNYFIATRSKEITF